MSNNEQLSERIQKLEEQVRALANAISRHGFHGIKPGDDIPAIIERLEKLERDQYAEK